MNTYFGDNLYNLRRRFGMSQEEFAERLGVSRQAVSKWERCEAYPDTENLIAISRLFGVTLDELVNSDIKEDTATLKEEYTPYISESDEDCEDDEKGQKSFSASLLISLPYPIVITVVYLILGFFTERGWAVGWTLYVTIPVWYSFAECIKARRFSSFAYPVFITFIYLLLGMLFGIWHPLWIIFLTIPVYYAVAGEIDKHISRK